MENINRLLSVNKKIPQMTENICDKTMKYRIGLILYIINSCVSVDTLHSPSISETHECREVFSIIKLCVLCQKWLKLFILLS